MNDNNETIKKIIESLFIIGQSVDNISKYMEDSIEILRKAHNNSINRIKKLEKFLSFEEKDAEKLH